MKTVIIKELGIVAKSYYLQDRELANIGKEKECLKCNQPFIIGAMELHKKQYDPQRKSPRKKIEICGVARGTEFFKDVNLKENPIDLSKYTVTEQAIIFGVECLEQHICPTCRADNATHAEAWGELTNGGGERSHFGGGEIENN
jgi:hypothetical protein